MKQDYSTHERLYRSGASRGSYHHNFNCWPLKNCLPTEQNLNQLALFRLLAEDSTVAKVTTDQETISFKLKHINTEGIVSIEQKDDKHSIKNVSINSKQVFDSNKPFSVEEKETQRKRRDLINTKNKPDERKLIGTGVEFYDQSFQVEKVKISNKNTIHYYNNAVIEFLKYIPLIFEKNSEVKIVYLDLKEEYEKIGTQESVLATKTVKLYETCFILSF